MDLLSIRQQFVKISGRYDLASTDVYDHDTDEGADFYINSGMRFLDKRFQTVKTKASYFKEAATGVWYLTCQGCLVIEEVWCNDTKDRWELKKYSYKQIKESYAELVTSSTGGPPLFYSPIWLRAKDATDFQSLGTFFNYVKSDDDGTYNGIIFTPKTDKSYNIEIVGKFLHTDLSDNSDENFWTTVAPELLLKASLYQLNAFYGDIKKSSDWLASIDIEGSVIEKNLVDQESVNTRVED